MWGIVAAKKLMGILTLALKTEPYLGSVLILSENQNKLSSMLLYNISL